MVLSQVYLPSVRAKNEAKDAPDTESLDIPELIEYRAAEAGVDPYIARKIAFCESTFRQFAEDGSPLRGLHNASDVGLFQINEKYHLAKSRELGLNIYELEGNIAYALYLIKEEGIHHWNWSKPCWSKDNPEA